jgi:hypothetical protein
MLNLQRLLTWQVEWLLKAVFNYRLKLRREPPNRLKSAAAKGFMSLYVTSTGRENASPLKKGKIKNAKVKMETRAGRGFPPRVSQI